MGQRSIPPFLSSPPPAKGSAPEAPAWMERLLIHAPFLRAFSAFSPDSPGKTPVSSDFPTVLKNPKDKS